MTTEQMNAELLYHASLAPFKSMLKMGMISEDDYRVIDTILRGNYSPFFVDTNPTKPLIIQGFDGNIPTDQGGV